MLHISQNGKQKLKISVPCHQMLARLSENWITHILLVEMQNNTTTLENCLQLL